MADKQDRFGGRFLVVEGELLDLLPVTEKRKAPGVVLAWFGDNQYLKLGDATQAAGLEVGSRYRAEAVCKEGQTGLYAGHVVKIEPVK